MYKIFSLLLMLFTSMAGKSQIDKGTWLVGGTGNLLSSKNEYTSPNYSSSSDKLTINVSPNIGFFVADKFTLGLKANYSKYKEQINGSGGGNSNINRFSFGPFARYYILEKDKPYNILSEITYQYGLYSFKPTNGNSNTFNALIGPVVYFNSSVALEFLLGYYSTKEVIRQNGDFTTKQSGFQISVGFQFHLEK